MNRDALREFVVPPKSLTIWWLGQGSFVVKSPGGKIIAIDPYLSNSCKALGDEIGFNFDRKVPPPITAADLVGIDLYVLSHSHLDHLDPETLQAYRAGGGNGPYLAPAETIDLLQAMGVDPASTTMTWPNKTHAIGDMSLRTTFAIPSAGDDLTHVGYLVSVADGPTVYFTCDTAYEDILRISVGPHKPDMMVCVINGGFRNMGPAEAARLARELGVKVAAPSHYELFPDNCQPPEMFHTNLKNEGIGDIYRKLGCAQPFTYPETTSQ